MKEVEIIEREEREKRKRRKIVGIKIICAQIKRLERKLDKEIADLLLL